MSSHLQILVFVAIINNPSFNLVLQKFNDIMGIHLNSTKDFDF